MTRDTEEIKRQLTTAKAAIPVRRLLSSSGTLLNLACSGRVEGAYPMGSYVHIVGDSQAGKSVFANAALAEAANNDMFDDHDLIYDGPEGGVLFNREKFFGKKAARRIVPPFEDDGQPGHSRQLEEFYYRLHDLLKDGKPFVYVLDSQTVLKSKADDDKYAKNKKAFEEGDDDTAGSYGMARAKAHNDGLGMVVPLLCKSDSILFMVSQTRDKPSKGWGKKKTYSGGRALKFYATLEMWYTPIGDVKKEVLGKERQLGINTRVEIEKNRVNGRERVVDIPILHSFGVDDVGSCVDFLISEKHWVRTKDKGPIEAKEFGIKGYRDQMVEKIDREGLWKPLTKIVGEVWDKIEKACEEEMPRTSRYQ